MMANCQHFENAIFFSLCLSRTFNLIINHLHQDTLLHPVELLLLDASYIRRTIRALTFKSAFDTIHSQRPFYARIRRFIFLKKMSKIKFQQLILFAVAM